MTPFLEANELLSLIQQLTRPYQGFSFSVDADQRFCAGKADEEPGLVAKKVAKTICGIYFGHSGTSYGGRGAGA